MQLKSRLHTTISLIAAFASKHIGQQQAEDKDPAADNNIQRRRTQLHLWRPTNTFGTLPPVIDPGGVHAYAKRHR
jgi:hypothetical protein